MNGKGDSPRNCFSEQFRSNFDHIFRRKPQLPQPTSTQLRDIKRQLLRDGKRPLR
jgi:hypothetical protein